MDKELYVFACSMSNIMLAHPYKPGLVGQDVNEFKDAKGNALFQEFRKIVEERGSGWVDYWWTKPGEKGEFPKRTYVKRMPGSNIYVGVGYYKPLELSQDVNQPDTN
ncbi:MAG: cache domain-containing protein [Desulfomonilaceae bacterium]